MAKKVVAIKSENTESTYRVFAVDVKSERQLQ